jgi:hypothetical protein
MEALVDAFEARTAAADETVSTCCNAKAVVINILRWSYTR